jgi:hypothetical protein
MNLFDRIRAWADSKRIPKDETDVHRFAKVAHAMDELMLGFVQHDRAQALDGLGNLVVELTLFATHMGLPIETAIHEAWTKRLRAEADAARKAAA